MQDPIQNNSPENIQEQPKVDKYYDFSKAYMNNFAGGDILGDASRLNLSVEMPSIDVFSKRMKTNYPNIDDKTVTDYYGEIDKSFQQYKRGDYNKFLDTNFTWFPDNPINRGNNPDLVNIGTVTPIKSDPMFAVTPIGTFKTQSFDEVQTNLGVVKDNGLWIPKDQTNKTLVGKDGNGIDEPFHYWETVNDDFTEYLDPQRIESAFGDRTLESHWYGTLGRSLWSGSIPFISKGLGALIGGVNDVLSWGSKGRIGKWDGANSMMNWGNQQSHMNEDEQTGTSGFFYSLGSIVGMIGTSWGIGAAFGVAARLIGGAGSALTAETIGTEGMAAIGKEVATKSAGKLFQKSAAEVFAQRTNMTVMATEMASGVTEKMNMMGITDPKERALLYFPTLVLMGASLNLAPAKIISGMWGSAARKEVAASMKAIYGEPITNKILAEGSSKAAKEAFGKRLANNVLNIGGKIRKVADGSTIGRYAMNPVETTIVVSAMGASNVGVQTMYNTIKDGQAKSTMALLGDNVYGQEERPYGMPDENGNKKTRTVYTKKLPTGLSVDMDYDVWKAEQEDVASAKNFLEGTGRFETEGEMGLSGLAPVIVASLLSHGGADLFRVLKTKGKKQQDKEITTLAITFLREPKKYQEFIDRFKDVNLSEQYINGQEKNPDGSDKTITADQKGKVPSKDDVVKQDLLNRINYKMEIIKRYGLLGLATTEGSTFDIDSETGSKTIELLKNIEEQKAKHQALVDAKDEKGIAESQLLLDKFQKDKEYLMDAKDPEKGFTKSQAYNDAIKDKTRFNNFLDRLAKSRAENELKGRLKDKTEKVDDKELEDLTRENKKAILGNANIYKNFYDAYKVVSGANQFDVVHKELTDYFNQYHDIINKANEARGVEPGKRKNNIGELLKDIEAITEYKFDEEGKIRYSSDNKETSHEEYKKNLDKVLNGIMKNIEDFRYSKTDDADKVQIDQLIQKYRGIIEEHSKTLNEMSDASPDNMNLSAAYNALAEKGQILPSQLEKLSSLDYNKIEEMVPYKELSGLAKEERYWDMLEALINQNPTIENGSQGYGGSYIDQLHTNYKSVPDKDQAIMFLEGDGKVNGGLKDMLYNLKVQIDENRLLWQDKIEPNKETWQYSALHDHPGTKISQENYDKFNQRYTDLETKIDATLKLLKDEIKTRELNDVQEGMSYFSMDNGVFKILNENVEVLLKDTPEAIKTIISDGYNDINKIIEKVLKDYGVDIDIKTGMDPFEELYKLYRTDTPNNEKKKKDINAAYDQASKVMVDMLDKLGDGKLTTVLDNIDYNDKNMSGLFWKKEKDSSRGNHRAFNDNAPKSNQIPISSDNKVWGGANTNEGLNKSFGTGDNIAYPTRSWYMHTFLSRINMAGTTIDGKKTPSYKQLYQSQRDVILKNEKDIVPNSGQEATITHMLMHYYNPENIHFSKLMKKEAKEHQDNYVPGALVVNGYASAGKTTVMLKSYFKSLQLTEGFSESNPLRVRIVVPHEDLVGIHRRNLQDLMDAKWLEVQTQILYDFKNNVVEGNIEKSYDILVFDEGSLLNRDVFQKIKKDVPAKMPKLFLTDDSQPSSMANPSILLPADKIGESTRAATQLYRTGVDQLMILFDLFRAVRYDNSIKDKLAKQTFFWSKKDGIYLGVEYSNSEKDVISNFKKYISDVEFPNNNDVLLIVPTEAIRQQVLLELNGLENKGRYSELIRTMENIDSKDSHICSGIASKTVFLAANVVGDVVGSRNNMEVEKVEAIRRAILSGPRAKQYLNTVWKTELSVEGRVNVTADQSKNTEGQKKVRERTLERLNTVLGTSDYSKAKDVTGESTDSKFDSSSNLYDPSKISLKDTPEEKILTELYPKGKEVTEDIKNTTSATSIAWDLYKEGKELDPVNEETRARNQLFRMAYENSMDTNPDNAEVNLEKLVDFATANKDVIGLYSPEGFARSLTKLFKNPLITQALEGDNAGHLAFYNPYIKVDSNLENGTPITGVPFAVKVVGKTADGKFIVDIFDINFHKNNSSAMNEMSSYNQTKLGMYAGQMVEQGFIVNNLNVFNVFLESIGPKAGLAPVIKLVPSSFINIPESRRIEILKKFKIIDGQEKNVITTKEQLYNEDRIVEDEVDVREGSPWMSNDGSTTVNVDNVVMGKIDTKGGIGKFVMVDGNRVSYEAFKQQYKPIVVEHPNLARSTSIKYATEGTDIGFTPTHNVKTRGILDILYNYVDPTTGKKDIWNKNNPGIELNLAIRQLMNGREAEMFYESNREGFTPKKDGSDFDNKNFMHSVMVRIPEKMIPEIMDNFLVKSILEEVGITTVEQFKLFGLDVIANRSLPEYKFKDILDTENPSRGEKIPDSKILEFLQGDKVMTAEDFKQEFDAFANDPDETGATRKNLIDMNVKRLNTMRELYQLNQQIGEGLNKSLPTIVKEVSPGNAMIEEIKKDGSVILHTIEDRMADAEKYDYIIDTKNIMRNIVPGEETITEFAIPIRRNGYIGSEVMILNAAKATPEYIKTLLAELGPVAKSSLTNLAKKHKSKDAFLNVLDNSRVDIESTEAYRFIDANMHTWQKNASNKVPKAFRDNYLQVGKNGKTHIVGDTLAERANSTVQILNEILSRMETGTKKQKEDFTSFLFKPVFKERYMKGKGRFEYDNLITENLVTRFKTLSLPNVWIDAKGSFEAKKAEAIIEKKAKGKSKYGYLKVADRPLPEYEFKNIENSKLELKKYIGENAENAIFLNADLVNSNDVKMFGNVKDALVTLYTYNHGTSVEANTPRHEAVHFILSYLVKPEVATEILKSARAEMIKEGKEDLSFVATHEYLAKGFETYKKPNTLVGKFISWMKNILARVGLYKQNMNSFYYGVETGNYTDVPIMNGLGSELSFDKKDKSDPYDDIRHIEEAEKIFGNNYHVNEVSGMLANLWYRNSQVSNSVDNFSAGIRDSLAQVFKAIQKEYQVDVNDLGNTDARSYGTIVGINAKGKDVVINKKPIHTSEMDAEMFSTALNNPGKGNNDDMVRGYITHQLGKSQDLFLTIMKNVMPDYNLQKIYNVANELIAKEEALTGKKLEQEKIDEIISDKSHRLLYRSAEESNYQDSASVLMKAMMRNIELKEATSELQIIDGKERNVLTGVKDIPEESRKFVTERDIKREVDKAIYNFRIEGNPISKLTDDKLFAIMEDMAANAPSKHIANTIGSLLSVYGKTSWIEDTADGEVERIGTHYYVDIARKYGNQAAIDLLSGSDSQTIPSNIKRYYGSLSAKSAEKRLEQMKDMSTALLTYFKMAAPREYLSIKFVGSEKNGTSRIITTKFTSKENDIKKDRIKKAIEKGIMDGDTINKDVVKDFTGKNSKYKVSKDGVEIFTGDHYEPVLTKTRGKYFSYDKKEKNYGNRKSELVENLNTLAQYFNLPDFNIQMIETYDGKKLNDLAATFHHWMLGVKISVGKDNLLSSIPRREGQNVVYDEILNNAYKGLSATHASEFDLLKSYVDSNKTSAQDTDEMMEKGDYSETSKKIKYFLPNIFYKDINGIAETMLNHSSEVPNKMFKTHDGNSHYTQVVPSTFTDLFDNGSEPVVINEKRSHEQAHFYEPDLNIPLSIKDGANIQFNNAILNKNISFGGFLSFAEIMNHKTGAVFSDMVEGDIFRAQIEATYNSIFNDNKGEIPTWTIPFADKPNIWMTYVTHNIDGIEQSLAIQKGGSLTINQKVLSKLHTNQLRYFERERSISMDKILSSLNKFSQYSNDVQSISAISDHTAKAKKIKGLLNKIPTEGVVADQLRYDLTKTKHYKEKSGVFEIGNGVDSNQVLWTDQFRKDFYNKNVKTDEDRTAVIRKHSQVMLDEYKRLVEESGARISANTMKVWEPLSEIMFHNFMTFSESLGQLSRGSSSFYDGMTDNIKRAAGLVAPRATFNISSDFGPKMKVVVLRDIAGNNTQFNENVDVNGVPISVKALHTDGSSPINPVTYFRMNKASGGSLGQMTAGALKTVNFDYDTLTDELMYGKFAQYPIDFYSVRSEYYQSMLKMMIGAEDTPEKISNWTKYKDRLLKSNESFNKAIEEMALSENYNASDHIDYVMYPSSYKSGARGIQNHETSDGSSIVTMDNAKVPYDVRNNPLDINTRNLGIQQDLTHDVENSKKVIATQLLYVAGVSPHNSEIVNKITSAVSSFVDMQIETLNGLGTKEEVLKYVKQASVNILNRETNKNKALLRDGSISAYAYSKKVFQALIDETNNLIKPDMPGQSMTHKAGVEKIYFDKNNNPHLALDLKLEHDGFDVPDYTKRRMMPALYFVKTDKGYVEIGSRRELEEHAFNGKQIVYRPAEVAMPFTHRGKFGIGLNSTLMDIMKIGGDNGINMYDTRSSWDNNNKPVKMGFEDYKAKLTEYFKDDQRYGVILEKLPLDVNLEIGKRIKEQLDIKMQMSDKDYAFNKGLVIDELARYYDDLNKALDVMVVRVPTTNGSSAFMGRIIAFLNGSANTINVAAEKNILDGTDYDADQLQVFFRAIEDNGAVPLTDQYKINQNQIFNAIEEFYHTPANYPLVLNRINKDAIIAKANEVSYKGSNSPLNIGSVIHTGSLNRSDLQGHMAQIQKVISKMLSIPSDKKAIIFPSKVRLMHNDNFIAETMEVGNTNINAAVDNATIGGALNQINFNQATTGVISGIMMYHPELRGLDGKPLSLLNTLFAKITDSPVMRYVADITLKSKGISEKTTDVWHELYKLQESESFSFDGQDYFISDGKTELDVPETNIIYKKDIAELMNYAAIGENGRRTADFISIQTKGLPNDLPGLLKLKDQFEKNLGRTIEDQINDVDSGTKDYPVKNQFAFLQKDLMRYSLSDEITNKYERAVRSSFNLPMFIGAQKDVMSYVKALDANIKAGYKLMPVYETLYGDAKDSVKNITKDLTVKEWKYESDFDDFNNMMNDHLSSMFLSDKYQEFIHNGKQYDLGNGQDRTWFVLEAPKYVEKLKHDNPYNQFLLNVDKDSNRAENFQYLELRNSKNLDKDELSRINMGWKELPVEAQEFFRVYNFILNGLNFRHGSFTDIMDTVLEKNYSQWADNLEPNYVKERLTNYDNKLLFTGLTKYHSLLEGEKVSKYRGGKIYKESFGRESVGRVFLADGTQIRNPYLSWMNGMGDNMVYTKHPVLTSIDFKTMKEIQAIRDGLSETESVHIRYSDSMNEIFDKSIVSLRDGTKVIMFKEYQTDNKVTLSPIDKDGHILKSAVSFDNRSHTTDVLNTVIDKLKLAFPNVKIEGVSSENSYNKEYFAYITPDGKVEYNVGKAEPGSMMHEFVGHIFTDVLATDNSNLYKSFEQQAIRMIESKDAFVERLLQSSAYKDLSRPMLIKEVIANLIGFTSQERINMFFEGKGIELKESETKAIYDAHKGIIQKVWDWVKEMFGKLFNIPVNVSDKINPNMTIQEFAKVMTDHILNERGPLSLVSSSEYADIMNRDFITMNNLSVNILKKGVGYEFEQTPELSNIGTPEQYSQYLDTIFPDNSIISGYKSHFFEKGQYSQLGEGNYIALDEPFTTEDEIIKPLKRNIKEIRKVNIVINKTKIFDADDVLSGTNTSEIDKSRFSELFYKEYIEKGLTLKDVETSKLRTRILKEMGYIGEVAPIYREEENSPRELVIFDNFNELGSKQDIIGFKNFVKEHPNVYASAIPEKGFNKIDDTIDFLRNNSYRRKAEYTQEEKEKYILSNIKSHNWRLPKEVATADTREINFKGMKVDEMGYKIKEIAEKWTPGEDSIFHGKLDQVITKGEVDLSKTSEVFGTNEDGEFMPQEVLEKYMGLINHNNWTESIHYNELAESKEYGKLFNEDLKSSKHNPYINIIKSGDGNLFVSLYDVTDNQVIIPEEIKKNNPSMYHRLYPTKMQVRLKGLTLDNSEGDMRYFKLALIAQDMMRKDPRVQIKDIGVIQLQGRNGVEKIVKNPRDIVEELRTLSAEKDFKAILDKEGLGSLLETSKIKPLSIDNREYLLSVYNNDPSKPAWMEGKLTKDLVFDAQNELNIYQSRIRDILYKKGVLKTSDELSWSDIDELKTIKNIIDTFDKTPLVSFQQNSSKDTGWWDNNMVPTVSVENELFQTIRTLQLNISNKIIDEFKGYTDKLNPIFTEFRKDYENNIDPSAAVKKFGWELTHKYYEDALVTRKEPDTKDANGNIVKGREYGINFLYLSKDEKQFDTEDPNYRNALMAKEKGISDVILKRNNQIADAIDDMMVKNYRNYQWVKGFDYSPTAKKLYDKMSDAEVMAELLEKSSYKRGMVPVMDMTIGGLTGAGEVKEVAKKKGSQLTSALVLYDELAGKRGISDKDNARIADSFLYQFGIDKPKNTLGSDARLRTLGLRFDPLTNEYIVEDAQKNSLISKDIKTTMEYFMHSSLRKIHYEQEFLPYANLYRTLLWDMEVNQGMKVEGIKEMTELWINGAVKGTRQISDAKIPGLNIRLDPLASGFASMTRTIVLAGNVNIAIMTGFNNLFRTMSESIANSFVDRGVAQGSHFAKASMLYLSDHARAKAWAEKYAVINSSETDLLHFRGSKKRDDKKEFWSNHNMNLPIRATDNMGRTIGMIAQMLYDGSWDAHQFNKDTGKTVYKKSLDKRWQQKDGNVLYDEFKKQVAKETDGLDVDGEMTKGYDYQMARIFTVLGDKWVISEAQNPKVKALMTQKMWGRAFNMLHTFIWSLTNNALETGQWMPDASRRVLKYDSEGKPTCESERIWTEGYVTTVLQGMKMLWFAKGNWGDAFDAMKVTNPQRYAVMKSNLIKIGTMASIYLISSILYNGLVKDDKTNKGIIPNWRIIKNVKYAYQSLFFVPFLLETLDSPFPAIDILKRGFVGSYGQKGFENLMNLVPGKSGINTLTEPFQEEK